MAPKSKASPARQRAVMTILGCGTSTGVPVIGCKCKVCRSRNPKNQRLRCSAWLQINGKNLLVDTSTDFRTQALTHKIPKVDAVLYTHPHADHIHGIDELRCYNFIYGEPIPVYGNAWTCSELSLKFPYIFRPGPVEGGGIPQLTLNEIQPAAESIDIQGISVVPIVVPHGSRETLGYRFDSVAYVTDCSYIPSSSLDRLKGLSVLVLDCVRIRPHRTHLNLDQALEVISQVCPKKAYLTHLGHEFDYAYWTKKLPKGVALAYDGLKIRL
jgi:phosphoribosyl 1,2-cyclic phosphate phosphodiesterase